jgi:hypothetical protein
MQPVTSKSASRNHTPGVARNKYERGKKYGYSIQYQGSGSTTHFSAKGCFLQQYYYLRTSDFYKEGVRQKPLQLIQFAKTFIIFQGKYNTGDEKE